MQLKEISAVCLLISVLLRNGIVLLQSSLLSYWGLKNSQVHHCWVCEDTQQYSPTEQNLPSCLALSYFLHWWTDVNGKNDMKSSLTPLCKGVSQGLRSLGDRNNPIKNCQNGHTEGQERQAGVRCFWIYCWQGELWDQPESNAASIEELKDRWRRRLLLQKHVVGRESLSVRLMSSAGFQQCEAFCVHAAHPWLSSFYCFVI